MLGITKAVGFPEKADAYYYMVQFTFKKVVSEKRLLQLIVDDELEGPYVDTICYC